MATNSNIPSWPWPLTPKSIGLLLGSQATDASNIIIVNQKIIELLCRNFANRVIVQKFCKVQSLNLTLTFDLLTSISIEVLLGPWSTRVWRIVIVCHKVIELSCRNNANFNVQIWPWPFLPKINRGPHRLMVNTCEKNQQCMPQAEKSLKSKFDLDLWSFVSKIKRGPQQVMVNTCVKYHHFKSTGKGVIVQKPLFYRQTDGQTAMVKPVYPP